MAERKIEERLPFSEEAVSGLVGMWEELKEMAKEVKESLDKEDK